MNQNSLPINPAASLSTQEMNPTEPHHAILDDPTWAAWRWSVVRGAGFPVDYPLQLAAPLCAAAADQFLLDEQLAQNSQTTLITMLTSLMDSEPTQRVFLGNILQNLHKGKLPTGQNITPILQEAVALVQQARTRVEASWQQYAIVFAASLVQVTERVQTLVAQEPFRQALAWQNRQALHTAVTQFLEKPVTTTTSHYRQHRTLLVKYLQRYCLKNDTIGYFGPVGWARWMPERLLSTVDIGPTLLSVRTTYLEGWGINALSQTLATDSVLRQWAIPRLMPFAYIEGLTIHLPFVKPLPLTSAQAHVLGACDGTVTAQQLAQSLVKRNVAGLMSEADVYAILQKLLATRRIMWDFNVPPEDPFPERALRRRLEMIEPRDLRTAALAKLAQLEDAAAQIHQSVANADHLDQAIGQLEATFTTLTQQSSTRSQGKLYAGRTLVYEDTVRNVVVTLGADVWQGMQEPLTALLTSARWLAHELFAACQRAIYHLYTDLVTKNGTDQIEFTEFFPLINAELFDDAMDASPIISGPVQTRFQQKWAEILGLPHTERQLTYTSATLNEQIAATFASPVPGWPLGHYHCPDIMLAAADSAALNRGDFFYVMGELHLGMNTLDAPIFVRQHHQREDLYRAIQIDLPAPRIIPLISSQFLPATRTHQHLALPKDYRLVTVPEVCDALPAQILRLGDLIVEAEGDHVIVRTRDGRLRFPIMEVMGDYFSLAVGDCFRILPSLPHTPRITIDRMIVSRESWRLRADAVNFVQSTDPADNFARVRAWTKSHDMPRFLFYRTPKEKKPCFLDSESPLSVELFVKDVRRMLHSDTTEEFIVSLSEMIPDPDHSWLTDAQGHRYTSEIRIAVVDRKDRMTT